jgi:hypothetical protein
VPARFACFVARLPRVLAVLLGSQAVNGRVEPVLGRRVATGGALTGSCHQRRPVGRCGVSVAGGVEAVDRRLLVTGRGITCFRDAIAPLSVSVTRVGRVDQASHPFITRVANAIPRISDSVTVVRGRGAFVSDVIPLVSDSLALIPHAGVSSNYRLRSQHVLRSARKCCQFDPLQNVHGGQPL